MTDRPSESVLIARAVRNRDRAAFGLLVRHYQSPVRLFLLRLCRDRDGADDLAQDTFVTAYQKLSGFKATGSFQGWLFRIAYHRFLMAQRSRKREREIMSRYSDRQLLEGDQVASLGTDQADLEKALMQLASEEAAAITLSHSYGFSHGEIAAILGTPLGTVKSRIRRGMDKLQGLLANDPAYRESADNKVAV